MDQILVTITPDPLFLSMVWEEFFQSRGRGITLKTHFPWIEKVSDSTLFVHMYDSGKLLGGLVLVDRSSCMLDGAPRTAALGLVCIHPDYRGKGLSKTLLRHSIQASKDSGYGAITLWTSKWAVYEACGFELHDSLMYGTVTNQSASVENDLLDKLVSSDAIQITEGIPPFAKKMFKVQSEGAAYIILFDGISAIVAKTEGDPDRIAKMLAAELPYQWKINLLPTDSLLGALHDNGLLTDLNPVKLQMWLSFDNNLDAEDVAKMSNFSVLDRI